MLTRTCELSLSQSIKSHMLTTGLRSGNRILISMGLPNVESGAKTK